MAAFGMNEDGSPKKNVYHSALVRRGRLMLRFKGDPRESKYPKGSATHYTYFQLPDDDIEYCLLTEDNVVAAIEAAPKDKWLSVTAHGGADVPSSLAIEDDNGPFVPGPIATPQDGPPPMWPDDALTKPPAVPFDSGPMEAAWNEAVALVERSFAGATADAKVEAASRVANTIFIQRSR